MTTRKRVDILIPGDSESSQSTEPPRLGFIAVTTRFCRDAGALWIWSGDMSSSNGAVAERPEGRITAKAEKIKAKSKSVEVPSMKVERIRVRIRSMDDSPLLMQCFSEKSKTEMLERQMKVAKAGKQARNPVEEFVHSLWWMDPSKKPKNPTIDDDTDAIVKGHEFGIPARLFKQSIVDAGDKKLALPKTMLRGAFYIGGKLVGTDRLVPIKGTPIMDQRHVRLATGSADLRFRGFFTEWSAVLDIEFDASAISKEQLLALISQAGWRQGICDFRPATCGGDFGRYVLDTE